LESRGRGHESPGDALLDAAGKGLGRSRGTLRINNWLCSRCCQALFGSHGQGSLSEEEELRDGIHLTKQGKSTFAKRLANPVQRVLNTVHMGTAKTAYSSVREQR